MSDGGALRILILEDREADAELMQQALLAEGIRFTATRVWTESAFEGQIREHPPDLILADLALPAYDGHSALKLAAREHPEIPFIFVSGSLGEETAINALHHGATDYVLKHRLSRLGPAVRRALREIGERQRRENAEQKCREAEQALRQGEARFETLFDHVADGILLVDPDTGLFVMANRTMGGMLGSSVDELTRLGLKDIHDVGDFPAMEAAFRQERSGDSAVIHDFSVKRRDGTAFFADVYTAPVTLRGRRLMMMNVRDVTERRALQAAVVQADRLSSMGLLAAGVAHEINNPLSYVLYNVETLAQELPNLPATAHLDDLIRSAAEALAGTRRIRDIARGLSTLSRVGQVERTEVDLNYVIDCAASMAQNEIKYRARLVKDFGPVPGVWASEGQLSQVFLNLLINAVHATPEGHPDRHCITVTTRTEGGHVVAEVADTGTGIPPEHLERGFEPFFTTKPAGVGSGLGLAISKNIIRELGGDIRVESQVGAGARFVVRLPVPAGMPAGTDETVDPSQTLPAVRGRVLIVDDEELVRRMFQHMLETQHDVTLAASGAAAKRRIEDGETFDVILCDLMMSDVTGMEFHEWLLARDPDLAAQVVFLTGGAFAPMAVEFLNRVPNPRLEKPVPIVDLKRAIVERLDVRRGRGRQ